MIIGKMAVFKEYYPSVIVAELHHQKTSVTKNNHYNCLTYWDNVSLIT